MKHINSRADQSAVITNPTRNTPEPMNRKKSTKTAMLPQVFTITTVWNGIGTFGSEIPELTTATSVCPVKKRDKASNTCHMHEICNIDIGVDILHPTMNG